MQFRHLSFLVLAASSVGAASAITIPFDNASDYDNNFYELVNPTHTAWSSNNGGALEKISGNSATVVILNSTASGGIAGSGGTGASVLNNNLFNNPTITVDFSTPAFGCALGD